MTRQLSEQIDGLRGFAALYIICHHYFLPFFLDVYPWNATHLSYLLRYGQEVVIVFFMLSGFLSYLSWSRNPSISVKAYMGKKSKRVLPLYWVAVALSVFASYISGTNEGVDGATIWGNLLFLQDSDVKPGVWVTAVGGNGPLWYMSYQWWSYILFILLCKVKNERLRVYLSMGICFLGLFLNIWIPNHLFALLWYYWIFFLGTQIAASYQSSQPMCWRVIGVTCLMILTWLITHAFPNGEAFGAHPNLELRHFSIALLLVGTYSLRKYVHYSILEGAISIFRCVAPFSMGIYVFQVPVLLILQTWLGYSMTTVCLAFVFCLVFSYVVERIILPSVKI